MTRSTAPSLPYLKTLEGMGERERERERESKRDEAGFINQEYIRLTDSQELL